MISVYLLLDCAEERTRIDTLPSFRPLLDVFGLFQQHNSSRTCVYWNDEIDLVSDSIYEYGVPQHMVADDTKMPWTTRQ